MRRRLRVDPTRCDAHGVCAELLPERVSLDDWGYAVVDIRPLPEHLLEHARRAVDLCPRLALFIEDLPG